MTTLNNPDQGNPPITPLPRRRWSPPRPWSGWRFGWLEASFLVVLVVALAMRLYELEGRAMHYDEAIHLQYAWDASRNLGSYRHSAWMHGPFQIVFVGFVMRFLGDSDFMARLTYVMFGTALVALPYFLRSYLGHAGALSVAVLLALSPNLIYFSRFGRNDILMAFFAAGLLVCFWRYIHEGKNRFLCLAAALLAFMFASKETSYMIILIFLGLAFLLGLNQLVPWAVGRFKASQLTGSAAFFVAMLGLVLPQWAALPGLFQSLFNLQLVTPEGGGGLTGAPQWEAPFVIFPIFQAQWWTHLLGLALLAAGLLWLSRKEKPGPRALLGGVAAPLATVGVVWLLLFQPISSAANVQSQFKPDILIAFGVAAGVAVLVAMLNYPWRRALARMAAVAALALVYVMLFTPLVPVSDWVRLAFPGNVGIDTSINGLPLNFVVAGGLVVGMLAVGAWLGLSWRPGVWLICAAIFYAIWVTLYTSVFHNWPGIFTGVWQGMGYWIAQQEVARGGQPWYYYFLGMSVYEALPFLFGVAAAVYYLRKGELLGIVLAIWSGLTLLGYTIASEKMPWLVVNITLPFCFLAGLFLGELIERVPWRVAARRGHLFLLVLPPLAVAAAVYILWAYLNASDWRASLAEFAWGVAGVAALAAVSAYVIRLARPPVGLALASLGVAALLLGFGMFNAVRAAYTFDDSHPELMVYAQGGADLPKTYETLQDEVFASNPERGAVAVDYDVWYPFQWYVRHVAREGRLQFRCFKAEGEAGYNNSCRPAPENPTEQAYMLAGPHRAANADRLTGYEETGPHRSLIWFPETYRRPGENRKSETVLEQLKKDFPYFGRVITSRQSWRDALNYLLLRKTPIDWYDSQYYLFIKKADG